MQTDWKQHKYAHTNYAKCKNWHTYTAAAEALQGVKSEPWQMMQVVSSRDEGLVRENRRKVEEGGARADWGWREGGDGDSAALPKGRR